MIGSKQKPLNLSAYWLIFFFPVWPLAVILFKKYSPHLLSHRLSDNRGWQCEGGQGVTVIKGISS